MQMEALPISVVIPAYNAGQRLRTAIESVLAQDFQASEILVVDDGSKDNTTEIANEYPQVTCIRQENSGASAARNRGIREAHGDWIAFLDADDYWYPNRLADAAEIIQANPKLQWCAGAYEEQMINGKVKAVGATKPALRLLRNNHYFDNFYQASLAGASFHTCSMTVRKNVFNEIGYFNEMLDIGEDIELWYRIADKYPMIGYLSRRCFRYVRAENTLTTKNEDVSEHFKNSVFRYTETPFGQVVEKTPHKALFFRSYVLRSLRHSLRMGRSKIVREIIRERSSWIPGQKRMFFYFLSYMPSAFLKMVSYYLRHVLNKDN